MNNINYIINQRVQDLDGYKATICYIGPVAASKNINETWIGVEWDDKTRGKHDGSCIDKLGKFHRYFECIMGAGSFVKPTKLKAPYSYYTAINDRYVAFNAPEIAIENVLPDAFVSTASGAVKSIEFVGEKKLRKWQQINMITKIAMRVSVYNCL